MPARKRAQKDTEAPPPVDPDTAAPSPPASFFSLVADAPGIELRDDRAAGQLTLWDDMDAAEKEMAKHGDFTAARFKQVRPRDAQRILELAAEVSIRRLAKVFGVSQNTIRALIHEHADGVDAQKQRLKRLCFSGAVALAERVVDEPDAFPKSSIPVALDVLARVGQLMDGAATSITEHRETVSIEDFNAYIDSLPAAQASETGLPPENVRALPAADELGDLVAGRHPLKSRESHAITTQHTTAPLGSPGDATAEPGGGGGRASEPA